MRNYATAQAIGTRDNQCDATAVATAPDGTRAYVLLDGIGSSDTVRDWTRAAARRLARTAARRGDAAAGLRALYNRIAAERAAVDLWSRYYTPKACAVVAVVAPGKPVTFAWCGDARAYLVHDGAANKVTDDHNLRRVFPACDGRPAGNRNRITSCLGSTDTDEDVRNHSGHPVIEHAVWTGGAVRLVLASDGAYEPHEDDGRSIRDELHGTPRDAARRLVTQAVTRSLAATRALDPNRVHADNSTALVADLTP